MESAISLDPGPLYTVYDLFMKIGELAKQAQVSLQTVRYYEMLGLLPNPDRTQSGHRVYTREALQRLLFIRQAQSAGFRLDEIREILRMKFAGRSPCDCVRTMLERKLETVKEQLQTLEHFCEQLSKTLRHARQLPRLPHRASAMCPLAGRQAESGAKR
jgi:DNA-binding transcriptional MerR regulator